MNVVTAARYCARLARDAADVARALKLRQSCFRATAPGQDDRDAFDAVCQHLLVEDAQTHDIVGYCRALIMQNGAEVARSYSATHYDLQGLARHAGPMIEIGRFCLAPGVRDPDILRTVWAALTRLVDQSATKLLFGCSSFHGVTPDDHRAALAHLSAYHLAPAQWRPGRKAPEVYDFSVLAQHTAPPPRAALAAMPPLLRSYVVMGGWVSDHAVIDRDLGTTHVFTGLEIAAIPAARARLLRADAAEIGRP